MTLADLLPLLIVAGLAGFVGYKLGRSSVITEQQPQHQAPASPLPAPSRPPVAEPVARERRSAPPPAAAGGPASPAAPQAPAATAPKRSSPPPPAAAGIADLDGSKHE